MATNAERLREIINVFASYGFTELYRRNFKKQTVEESATNLRLAFEELGPSFIKIGQTLATRNDLLSEPYINELQKLQNSSPSFPYEEADKVFQGEFGQSIKATFKNVNEKPIATGSIAQVHYAELDDGTAVIIKVQRPHIQEKLIRDIDLFIRVINRIPSIFTDIIIDPVLVLQDIRQQSVIELNFILEAQALIKFKKNHRERTMIKTPEIYLDYVSEKILVQEYIEGYDLTQVQAIKDAGYDMDEVAEKIVTTFLYQVFTDGYYHADPHPGNIIIDNGKIVYIDFGIMGDIPPMYQTLLINLLESLVLHDIDQLMQIILIVCQSHGEINEVDLYRDLKLLYNRYLTSGFWKMNLNDMFRDLMKIALAYKLTFPHEFVQLAKTVVIIQGIAQNLSPEMDFMKLFEKYITSSNKISIDKYLNREKLLRQASRTAKATVNFPVKIDQLLDNLNNERLGINLQVPKVESYIREINQMLNRLVIGILLASIIISAGLIASSATSERLINFGVLFFIIGIVMAAYLLYSFIRSRHK
ncbi:ABC1 kinase family protein [Fundicoccus culcitae]|uniref:AarF/UbiB family protein n=1 Tax=Fundicoccus culcitae TaxID=2969821 RepID=A0ABY5P6J8_9LACT|nr:lipopolysaccharide core heptose(II) kinase RfaY [Fundicoccus culcitae]UUX34361.1 AarF/UbiB family protein [Fundicoccus culcitae]